MKMAQLFLEETKGQDSEIAKMVIQSAKKHNQEAKTLKTEFPRVIEYLNKTAWAIIPEYLDLINDIVFARLNGATDLAEIEARIGRPLNNEHSQVEVSEDGTALIPVNGPIVKRASMFSRVSGMTSTEQLQSDIQAALDSPSVSKIHLDVDSPGGSVDGVKALSDFIFASRGKKPIIAFTDGSMASAAYWISSAADEIVASDTAIVGSIGVVAQHVDYSGRDAKDGRKRTYITAGKYKRIANDAEPLSAEGFDYLKRLIDSTYEVFVEDVARNRGVSKDKVLSDMADGKIFIGREALKVGLVDRIGTIQGVGGSEGMIRAEVVLESSLAIEAFTHNSKTAESEPEWGTVDKTKLPNAAHARMSDKKSERGYPHHHVVGGSKLDKDGCYTDGTMYLHKGGLNAAFSASQGARSGQKASPEIISHLEAHRKALGLDKEKTKKEVRNMDLQELKETHPDLVKAIAEEAKASVSGEAEGLKAKVAALAEENGKLAAENKELSRQVAIQEEAATKSTAEGIQKTVLAESGIPETLHAKVMKHVDFHTHVKDGKFDAEAFKTAFSADVKEWEIGLSGTTIAGAGVGDSRVDASGNANVDKDLINKVLGM